MKIIKWKSDEELIKSLNSPLIARKYSSKMEYFEKQRKMMFFAINHSENEPQCVNATFMGDIFEGVLEVVKDDYFYYWLYKGFIYVMSVSVGESHYSINDLKLFMLEHDDKERIKWEKLKRNYSQTKEVYSIARERIPEEVRIAVWRRDNGKCARCGSREKLEYDHIIPVSKGGGNTVRNIELLCEKCNREKSNNIQ